MLGNSEMKGWEAVPIIIPLFLILSIGTIWYFSFHHFKNRPRYQDFSSPMNSSAQQSRTSQVEVVGPQPAGHLVRLIDIPPLPPGAHSRKRQQGSPAPPGALRAQRSKDSLYSLQHSGKSSEDLQQGSGGRSVTSNGWNTQHNGRPQSYVIDFGTPPPIPAAHLRTPTPHRNFCQRPSPLTQLNAMPSSKKRRPELHLSLETQSVYSSHLSRFTASHGSVNDVDTTLVPEQSVASAETPPFNFPPDMAFDPEGATESNSTTLQGETSKEPKKIFVAKNRNFIFPSIKRELNLASPRNPAMNDLAEESSGRPSSTEPKSPVHSLTSSLRSFFRGHSSLARPRSETDADSSANRLNPNRPSISGPSLYNVERCSPEWAITQSEAYRNASPIPNPLVDHPDLEKGYPRPKEWGEKTPDLLEAQAISSQMRGIDRLRKERLEKVRKQQEEEEEEEEKKDWESVREEDDGAEPEVYSFTNPRAVPRREQYRPHDERPSLLRTTTTQSEYPSDDEDELYHQRLLASRRRTSAKILQNLRHE